MDRENQSPLLAAGVIEAAYRIGVRHAVLSPGSRSMPLISAFVCHPGIECHYVVDERVAGFVALGISGRLNEPVALVCTSGSALLNYGPALAEAYYRGVPLIVISADRPSEMIDCNDGQTMKQDCSMQYLFKDFSWTNIQEDFENRDYDKDLKWNIEFFRKALCQKPGPIHFNVRIDEPLRECRVEHINAISEINLEESDQTSDSLTEVGWNTQLQDTFDECYVYPQLKPKKVMLFIGQHRPDQRLAEVVLRIAESGRAVVIADQMANIPKSPYIISDIDAALAAADGIVSEKLSDSNESDDSTVGTRVDEGSAVNIGRPFNARIALAGFAPDLVITLGGTPLSRRMKEWFRSIEGLEHWSITPNISFENTYKCLEASFAGDVVENLDTIFLTETPVDNRFVGFWHDAAEVARDASKQYEAKDGALGALSKIVGCIPHGSSIICSNGLSVRFMQAIAPDNMLRYQANRGISGIEGCTSTAIGEAIVSDESTILFTGDMSAFYDLPAYFSGLRPRNLYIFIIDNDGGEIFRNISATKDTACRENYLCAMPHIDWEKTLGSVGVECRVLKNQSDLEAALPTLFSTGNSGCRTYVLKVGANSSSSYYEYYKYIKEYAAKQNRMVHDKGV